MFRNRKMYKIMIKKNILSLLLLFTALVTFNSCEVEDDEMYKFEQQLYGNVWAENYQSMYGEKVYHEIIFNPNGTGTEYTEYNHGGINTRIEKTLFTWIWSRDFAYSIEIYYPNDPRPSYFDDIEIVGNNLYVVWDDMDITLRAI